MRAGGPTTRIAAKPAGVVFQRGKGVFEPGLADLLEAVVVTSSSAHPVKILRNDRMIDCGQSEPIKWLVAVVAGSRFPLLFPRIPHSSRQKVGPRRVGLQQ